MIFKEIITKKHSESGEMCDYVYFLRISCNNYGSLFARYIVTPEKVCFRVIIEKENATLTSLENKYSNLYSFIRIFENPCGIELRKKYLQKLK